MTAGATCCIALSKRCFYGSRFEIQVNLGVGMCLSRSAGIYGTYCKGIADCGEIVLELPRQLAVGTAYDEVPVFLKRGVAAQVCNTKHHGGSGNSGG